jgi:hypothetical protein
MVLSERGNGFLWQLGTLKGQSFEKAIRLNRRVAFSFH